MPLTSQLRHLFLSNSVIYILENELTNDDRLEIWESREVSVKTEQKNPREERIKNTTAVTVIGSRGSSSEQEQGRNASRTESRQDIGHAV